jgi:hypothetical protein
MPPDAPVSMRPLAVPAGCGLRPAARALWPNCLLASGFAGPGVTYLQTINTNAGLMAGSARLIMGEAIISRVFWNGTSSFQRL